MKAGIVRSKRSFWHNCAFLDVSLLETRTDKLQYKKILHLRQSKIMASQLVRTIFVKPELFLLSILISIMYIHGWKRSSLVLSWSVFLNFWTVPKVVLKVEFYCVGKHISNFDNPTKTLFFLLRGASVSFSNVTHHMLCLSDKKDNIKSKTDDSHYLTRTHHNI